MRQIDKQYIDKIKVILLDLYEFSRFLHDVAVELLVADGLRFLRFLREQFVQVIVESRVPKGVKGEEF
jgi:hypothetical protein